MKLETIENRIFIQVQGGDPFQLEGTLEYFESLKREPNTEFGLKDIFNGF